MRTFTVLTATPDFTVLSVTCRDGHAGWSAPELASGFGLVLARLGGFRRRSAAGEVVVDPTVGYLTTPGDEEQFAHPGGGDHCTSIHLSARLWNEIFDDRPPPASTYVDARLDLCHRLVVRAARGPDGAFDAAERLLTLVAAAGGATTPVAAGPVASRRDRAVVEAAREAVRADDPEAVGLLPLARRLGVSPYRLSRSFHALVGVPLTRYRNRVRVGRALDRLERGDDDLAGLAALLGFADQAHLTRTVRAHVGHTPGALRRLLRG